jgi:hypothetical protein
MPTADALDELQRLQERLNDLQAGIAPLVRQARAEGASWATVAAALGMSKQAAWEQFRRFEI